MKTGCLRTRAIRPQVIDDERIAALGPLGVLLMVTLPMLADRDGLLEYRPDYIRTRCLPYFPDAGVEDLLAAVEKLGEISTYTSGSARYIHVSRFRAHQHVHPEEKRSILPAPPHVHRLSPRKRSRNRACAPVLQNAPKTQVGSTALSTNTEKYYGVIGGSGGIEQQTPPPLITPNPTPKPEPPEAESAPGQFVQAELPLELAPEPVAEMASPAPTKPLAKPVARPAPEPTSPPARRAPTPRIARKPASSERCSSTGTVNWWPHADADIDVVRDSLLQLAREMNMPPPDDGIVRKVLDKSHGASGDAIHAALVATYKRRKFQSMKSWGLVPIIMADYFRVVA